MTQPRPSRHIGFVSARFRGTDGVSLETEKWARALESMGFTCFYLAGDMDCPAERSRLVDEAHFLHPDVAEIGDGCFGVRKRSPKISRRVQELKDRIKAQLHRFLSDFHIDILIAENALSIPLNIPLGLAITEVIAETGIPTIAHHHDFYWERQRFTVTAATDYLSAAFPPSFPSLLHVVINTVAGRELARRLGLQSTLIPNVMDFEHPPAPPDEYAADVRQALGVQPGEWLVLQPTRVVPRKGIEHAIELVGRLGRRGRLVISHASHDEGAAYERRVRNYAALLDVNARFVGSIISNQRGLTPDGRKRYALADVYPHADLVTYPSTYEGFGNAFLEAIYYRKPIVVNRYSIYTTDIRPKGFRVIEFDGYITEDTVHETRRVLEHPELAAQLAEHNYNLGWRYYSFDVLRSNLAALVARSLGT